MSQSDPKGETAKNWGLDRRGRTLAEQGQALRGAFERSGNESLWAEFLNHRPATLGQGALFAVQRRLRRLLGEVMALDPDPARDEQGQNALMLLAERGGEMLLRMALPLGGEREQEPGEGLTALMIACQMGHHEAARLLLPGSDLSQRDWRGNSPLAHAAMSSRSECLALLLPLPLLDPRERNVHGIDALGAAAMEGSEACVRALLPLADLRARAPEGCSAAELAIEWGHRRIAGIIEAAMEADALGAALGVKASQPSKPRGL